MNKFVDLSREKFIDVMTRAGFGFYDDEQSGELVFTRRNWNHDLVVKVYSSIPLEGSRARACGEDAIRVMACYDPPQGKGRFRQIGETVKVLRVNSADGIVERTLQRARDAYAATNRACRTIGRAISTLEVVA